MKHTYLKLSLLVSLAIAGCAGTEPYDPGAYAVNGGLIGTAAGAGTGALIGAAIPHGWILGSTALGAGIGLPAGVVAGYAYAELSRASVLHEARSTVEDNETLIAERNEEIMQLRDKLRQEAVDVKTDQENATRLYPGPTIGAK